MGNILNLSPQVLSALEWFKGQPIILGLLVLMVLDIGVGLCLSFVKKTTSSAASWVGMSRKVIMILLVGASAVMQGFVPQLPILSIVSTFYIITEFLSILENAAAAGVPLPKGLTDALIKLREQQKLTTSQKGLQIPNVTINNTQVTPAVPVLPPKKEVIQRPAEPAPAEIIRP